MTATDAATPSDEELFAVFVPVFDRIAEGAVERERERRLPYEEVRRLRDAGLGRVRVPKKYGGLGATLPQLFRLLVRLGEADPNLTQIFRAHFGFVEGRLHDDEEDSRRRWLARVAAGDLFGAAMAERAEAVDNPVKGSQDGDHWVIDGEKFYCTGTLYADWIFVSVRDGEDVTSLAVPATAPGVTRIDDWDGFGQRLSASGTTRFDNVRVPEEYVLRRFRRGERGREGSYITGLYQQVHLANLAGIARAVLRDAVANVKGRTRSFGVSGKSSPADHPAVQRVVGRLSSLAFSAEALVEGVSASLERAWLAHFAGTATPEIYGDTDIRAFQAQQIVIHQVLEACSLLFEVGGASAASGARGLDRHWRNARTLSSHNPAILREVALGNYHLNGKLPSAAWEERLAAARAAGETAPPADSTEVNLAASGAAAPIGDTPQPQKISA
ncbi:acyl-CoA dehydrogenase family protein [Xylophilus sp.]|uniref:acyl-CoA dehydrogenase family protein n=1 Tax=Xylophilus sp. TaxID=2653893 RepID=UPI0013B8929A|nr:acyl-CoA dehydrogenase family protein [Xylophilus sp.]KAF1047548.1 MAG: Dibenzothiophene desulfurization enzyme C [Xylophilus sp.]